MASESSGSQSDTTAADTPRIVLACVFCHQRKIKCDRKSPCANCVKADQPCIPSKRAPSGAGRRRVKKDLLERLNHFETLLSQLAVGDGEGDPVGTGTTGPTAAASSPATSWMSWDEARMLPDSRPPGRIVSYGGRSTYMENSIIGDIVDHLPPSDLNDDRNDTEKPTDPITSTSITDHSTQPAESISVEFDVFALGPVEVLRLWQVFLERVNPMLKVIHVPSLEPLVFEAATWRLNLNTDFKALICCINAVSIMALSEYEAIQMLSVAKSNALRTSISAMKTALAETDFLRKYNITILQCLVLYLVSLQGHVDRHAAWVLTGALVRIAQRMGLHRDGDLIGLPPFETEMRRRIWWQIIMLETKYAILSGFCDTLLPPNWDTKMPSNVNDADLFPGSLEPVKSREGATEMAYCLMIYRCRLFFYDNPVPEFEAVILGGGNASMESAEQLATQSLDKYRQTLERYDEDMAVAERKYTDASAGGIHRIASKVRSVLTQRMRDMILHAWQSRDGNLDGQGDGRSFFRAWVVTFESDVNCYESGDEKFSWYLKLHFQTEAFSAMIDLLQWQPVGTLVDRAWKVIDRLYHYHQDMYDMGKKENLQRAENLLTGWSRREVAFHNLGISCSTPTVVAKLRTCDLFRQHQSSLPIEGWPTPAEDEKLSTGIRASDYETY
ncbi:hypothetical protein LX32DRAFT_619052 [Colletotrichum zoysiae]|uniref:Zn(2)-C6 fungal-type domain-containing protein n=1 Tax=Colletotrichum zoysiae TaxID=1216348 RepID=A0AAD9HIH5_9PEZI|nr:hypothetical protein LX32DRAFT_619052 [Colletotrichum zoysiae]